MKKEIQRLIFLSGAVIAMSACSKTSFSDVSTAVQSQVDIPLEPVVPPVEPQPLPLPPPPVVEVPPPVVVPPAPVYSFKLSSGACNSDSSTALLSCLKCDVPMNPPPPPQLSAKAQALVDAMFLACQIKNPSDRNNFRPTKEMLVQKLNRGSDALYPETTRTAQMSLVIAGLTNEADGSLRKKMFSGLWYQPPYSDAFETYFGLTVQEAKSTFCWDGGTQTPRITGVSGLYSKQWVDCQSYGNLFCKEIPAYVTAWGYRDQLSDVLIKSITQPYVPPAPLPAKTCRWDKFEGDDMKAASAQFKKWKAEGRQLSMEIKKANGVSQCGVASEKNLVVGYTVAMASYVCQ